MTSYVKMANVQEKAKCVLWFFETKSVIKTQRRYRTQYGKNPPSDNAIRRWLKQFKEIGNVLHRKGAGRPSISQEDVDRIQEAFTESPQNSTRRTALQLGIPQATVWRVLHNRLALHDSTGCKGTKRPGPTSSDPPRKRKCGICKQEGHNRTNCPNK